MVFFAKMKTKKKVEVKKKAPIKVQNVVKKEDIIILDDIEVCSRCGAPMQLERIAGNVKEFSCNACGKRLSKN